VSLKCSATNSIDEFATDPAETGWHTSGNTSLFHWNPSEAKVEVTWDSSRENSYLWRSLGTVVSKEDDFSFSFDLVLTDVVPGPNPSKPNTFQLSLGLINTAEAMGTNFLRGTGYNSPDIVDFSFFPEAGGLGASLTTVAVDKTAINWGVGYLPAGLTAGPVFHVQVDYASSNRVFTTTILKNGEPYNTIVNDPLAEPFTDFGVNAFAVCSYSDAGQDPMYAGSILAHGTVDNVHITVPEPPFTLISGSVRTNHYQVTFEGKQDWIYVLERTTDTMEWTAVAPPLQATSTTIELTDTNPITAAGLYRVKASKP